MRAHNAVKEKLVTTIVGQDRSGPITKDNSQVVSIGPDLAPSAQIMLKLAEDGIHNQRKKDRRERAALTNAAIHKEKT